MKIWVLLAIVISFVIAISMSIPLAFESEGLKEFYFVEEDKSVKILLEPKSNSFVLQDIDKSFNLFDSLIMQLYKGANHLFQDSLNDLKILSISRKYSDHRVFVVDFEFNIKRCSQDAVGFCESRQGRAELDVLLGRESLEDQYFVLDLLNFEIKTLW